MSELQQFLYVLVKETEVDANGKEKPDTSLRIVYWGSNEELGYDGHFVIYGKRPKSKITGKYTPYRLKCKTAKQIHQFLRTIIASDNNLAVELHQFYGYSDDSDDWYNIDWKNTPGDSSTEIVAFDVLSGVVDGEHILDFGKALTHVLNAIMDYEVV